MAAPCSARGGSALAVALLLVVVGAAQAGFVPPHAGPAGPWTVIRHAPPAVPPYSTQINVFRWLAAFPPPVLHRALLIAQGHPLHHPLPPHPVAVHTPVVHHAPPPVLPPPPPPLLPPPVVKPAVLSGPGLGPLPLPLGHGLGFPPEALPFPPSVLPTSAFFPLGPLGTRGFVPSPTGVGFGPGVFGLSVFPGNGQLTPTQRAPGQPTPPPPGFHPNFLVPSPAFFGPSSPPFSFDPKSPPSGAPQPTPSPAPAPSPSPAGLTFFDGHNPVHFRQFFPAVNGITRATSGNLAL